jgi:uncharacterized membrane protein YdjX (TVP38/TMEM64 family)
MEKIQKGRIMKRKIKKKESAKQGVSIALTVFLAAACIVFSVLCLYNTTIFFLRNNALLFSILSFFLFFACFFVVGWFIATKKQTLFKMGVSVLIFFLFCLVLTFIFQKTGFFDIVKDEKTLQTYLSEKGAWMPILYIVLQYLQVVILPIPSVVSTLAGVALFGPLKTIIYSLIGILLGSYTAFFIGRKLGYKAVAWMVGEDTLTKWQSKLKGKDNFILTLMFLLPVFPDDVLCFVAGLSTMSTRYFVIMILISRILAISTTCYSMQLLPLNTWWGLLIWAVIIILVAVAFVVVYKNIEKIQTWISKKFNRSKGGEKKNLK